VELNIEERSKGSRFRLFEKTQFSMLTGPVRAELIANSIEAVVLFGLETHVCILQTALDAAAMGLGVWIPMDGIAARFPVDHEAALGQLRQEADVKLSSCESILFQVLGDAKHSSFKAVSALCKRSQ
jgi:nicotinamidase-related amidase